MKGRRVVKRSCGSEGDGGEGRMRWYGHNERMECPRAVKRVCGSECGGEDRQG